MCFMFLFFKQKAAYEMRISDWSSDVCSCDLVPVVLKDEPWVGGIPATGGSLLFQEFIPAEDGTVAARLRAAGAILIGMTNVPEFYTWSRTANRLGPETVNQSGRASCRERVCQYV